MALKATTETNSCENCGRPIGKLETPRVYRDHVVCPECAQRLEPAFLNYQAPSSVPYARPNPRASAVLIEQTSKKWKKMQLAGAGVLLLGAAFAAIGNGVTAPFLIFLGVVTGVIGILVAAYGSIGGWWHHG